MNRKIFGRKEEKRILQAAFDKEKSAFIAVYGRRRIGKTFLIKEFFKNKDCVFFHLTGMQDGLLKDQLTNFFEVYRDVFGKTRPISKVPDSWTQAFRVLLEVIRQFPPGRKVVLFLDELPWLSSPKSKCLQALEYLWNQHLADMDNIKLVVCGSAASWMIDNVINNKGGLYGRVTHEIHLLPFTFTEAKDFLVGNGLQFDGQDLADLYMVIGGVAKYLEYVEPGLSIPQIISSLCFSLKGPLFNEFNRLFQSLFSSSDSHVDIVRALAKKRSGYTYKELTHELKLGPGGTFSKHLNELCLSGFVRKFSMFGKGGAKLNKYILIDEYSLFYLNWIENVSAYDTSINKPDYWMKQSGTPKFWVWRGLAFELMCLKHLDEIKKSLGISGVITRVSKWYHRSRESGERGVEIDLIIDRDDGCINLCETKFLTRDFTVDKQYAEILNYKRDKFRSETGTKKALFNTLITSGDLQQNSYSRQSIDIHLSIDDLFSL